MVAPVIEIVDFLDVANETVVGAAPNRPLDVRAMLLLATVVCLRKFRRCIFICLSFLEKIRVSDILSVNLPVNNGNDKNRQLTKHGVSGS